ncbi:YqhV family protein [Bacillus rhizoplanae]|uniref:YqhV family protein n=1 Tax=Bacillus rhizoplanae TaxID=2880966 RepID=UPI003D23AA60
MKQWLAAFETSVLVMALLRLFSGSMEIFAALLMLYFNDVKKALFVNGMLAFVGPTVLIVTMSVGIASVTNEISFLKLFFLALGIGCIFIAVLK